MKDTENRVRDTENRLRDTVNRVRDTVNRVRDTVNRVRDTVNKVRDTVAQIALNFGKDVFVRLEKARNSWQRVKNQELWERNRRPGIAGRE